MGQPVQSCQALSGTARHRGRMSVRLGLASTPGTSHSPLSTCRIPREPLRIPLESRRSSILGSAATGDRDCASMFTAVGAHFSNFSNFPGHDNPIDHSDMKHYGLRVLVACHRAATSEQTVLSSATQRIRHHGKVHCSNRAKYPRPLPP